MKLALLALLGVVSADHRCDDVNTGERNAIAGPLYNALQKALADKDAALKAKEEFDEGFSGNLKKVKDAEENLAQAQAQYDLTGSRVKEYQDDYEVKSGLFAECKPDDPDSKCDVNEQSQLSLQMVDAGKKMIDNDNQHNANRNTVEQMQLELNAVKSEYQFDAASFNTKGTRLAEDLSTAAQTYQNLKDQYDMHVASDSEYQEACKIAQYHSDMHEIERLSQLLDKCKLEGCTKADCDALGMDHITCNSNSSTAPGEEPDTSKPLTDADKKYTKGKINFPDCGLNVSAECFWLHYKQSDWLDFLSFFGYIPGLIGCAILDEYEYGLCLGNFAYILVDAYSKKAAPPSYFDDPTTSINKE